MATITEDYVSFETALLLKKKGFEQVGCQKQYNTQGDLCVGYCYGPVSPTLQMAMKWLRIEHNIHIEPHIIDADKLLKFVETGMRHSRLCAWTEPVTQNGEYDVVSDVIRRMDLFTYKQLELIRDYIIENRV